MPGPILTNTLLGLPQEAPPAAATTPSLILAGVSNPAREKDESVHDDVPPAAATTPSLILTEESNPTHRGTTNRNARGGSDARRRRREWLVQTFRANEDVHVIELHHGPIVIGVLPGTEGAQPACRCYRCGQLLTAETVTVDRIIPGCQGGTYVRNNIRPACGTCNSSTGATTRRKPGKGRK